MKEANAIVQAILDAEKIVITSHRSPDGDSIGSSLGLYHFIKQLGKDAIICHPDPCPDFIMWAKDGVEILDFENSQEEIEGHLKNADLLFSLDYMCSYRFLELSTKFYHPLIIFNNNINRKQELLSKYIKCSSVATFFL